MITTKSGKFRIFSIKDDARENYPEGSMFRLDEKDLQGDWTFEPYPRIESAIARFQREHGKQPTILYAPTFVDANEALLQAEIWERQTGS